LKGTLAKQDHTGKALLLDRAYLPFCIGIQIGRPRREQYTLHPSPVDNVLKGWTILAVSVMDKILA
jgi:hypothetical protein